MTERSSAGIGWFEDVDRGDLDTAREAIETGTAEQPADWPTRAINSGFATDEDDYYNALHEATVYAAREAAQEREMADDQQLKHSIRAMADCERTANELAERVAEWAASRYDETGTGVGYAREVAAADPDDPAGERLVALAGEVTELADEAADLRAYIERAAPDIAPNLAALAGPVLAARLISLAGGLEPLAKKPSGTVQVLGAEEALFSHLRGHAPSPKHGVIYVHDAVRNTDPEHRGSAARALAGKLSIAARIDHYSGERKPELDAELDERIARIRARTEEGGAS